MFTHNGNERQDEPVVHVLVVTKDVERGIALAKAVRDLELSVFFVESTGNAETYAQRLDASLVVLDGLLPEATLRGLAAKMLPRFEVALLAAPEHTAVAFPGLTVIPHSVDAGALQASLRSKLQSVLPAPAFSISEYVQLACMSRRTVRLRCRNAKASGHISIQGGEIWNALATDPGQRRALIDESAFRYWVTQDDVAVRVTARVGDAERSVFVSWEHLLLESMQLKDEGDIETLDESIDVASSDEGGDTGRQPSLVPSERRRTNRPTAAPPGGGSSYPERARLLVTDAIRAITSGNYADAERAFQGALELCPDDKLVAYRLRRVREFLKTSASK